MSSIPGEAFFLELIFFTRLRFQGSLEIGDLSVDQVTGHGQRIICNQGHILLYFNHRLQLVVFATGQYQVAGGVDSGSGVIKRKVRIGQFDLLV